MRDQQGFLGENAHFGGSLLGQGLVIVFFDSGLRLNWLTYCKSARSWKAARDVLKAAFMTPAPWGPCGGFFQLWDPRARWGPISARRPAKDETDNSISS